MKKFYNLVILFVLCINILSGQEYDLVLSSPESGTQTHVALNSITLAPNYSYTPNGGTLTCYIGTPWISGSFPYNYYVVDPETRSLNTSYMVGATNGIFNVNSLGGATYSIPLEMLPGINGLSPQLSLVYSSNSGPGLAGYGWQIAGLSAITRGPNTFYHDDKVQGIELDVTDRFYLNGQRLVTTNSYAYGHASAEYQTDQDIFTRVKQYETDAYGPGYFKAETKSGLIYEYGNTSGSKQKIGTYNQVLNWYVSKISDLFGNAINFVYQQDNNFVYPTEISYGPNKINFYYSESYDKNYSYFKGEKIEQRYILDKITINYNGNILKTYEFKYNIQSSNYNSFSTLNEVIEYGIGTSRINSTAFSYQIPENISFAQAIYNTTETYISYNSKLYSGDFNGDGKADLFCVPSSGGWRLYTSNGDNTFSLASTGDFSINESLISKCLVLDLNGDSRDDIVFYIPTTAEYYYAISNGSSFSSVSYFATLSGGWSLYKPYKAGAGDVNGDGFNDFIIINLNGEVKIYSYHYNGVLHPLTLRKTLNFGISLGLNDILFMADFNGDGLADIWKINSSGIKIYKVTDASLVEIYTGSIPTKDHFFRTGDFNADGRTDLFLYGYSSYDWDNWQIRLSNGISLETNSFVHKKLNLKDDVVRTGDFNGDGCTDLMVTANSDDGWNGHHYYLTKNKGTDFATYVFSAGQAPSHKYYLDDFDGDGREDYLCTDGVSPWWTGYMIYKAPGRTHTLMEKIGNGLSFLMKLTYTKLSNASSAIYQRGSGASFPVSDFQGPLTVVSSVQSDNGRGTLNTQNYYYEGLKLHMQGKGIIGYAKQRVTDVESGMINEVLSGYSTTYFYPRFLGSSKRLVGTSDPFETVTNVVWYDRVLNAEKKRIFPFIQSSVQTNVLTGHSVTATYNYDNYGNPTSIIKNFSGGPTETTTHTYSNIVSGTQWLLGRPATTTQSRQGGTTITKSATRSFGTLNNNLIYEEWFAGTQVGIKNEFEYNTNGTLKKQTVRDTHTNVYRSTNYSYETNGVRILTVTDPLSHVITNTYDTYGRLSTQTDYLNNIITYQYDNLHRKASVSKNDGSSATTTYNWQDPASTPLLARYSIQTTGNDGSQSMIWYDKLGRKIRSDVRGFDGNMIYETTEYNTKGQVYRISEPGFSPEADQWNILTYDNYGRKIGLTTPSGSNSTWQYPGNTITETTAGKTFSKTFASDGTLTSATDAGGTINYAYYPDGKIKTITAPGGITTTMQYDIAGNQAQLIDPSAGTINYTYNGFGELLTQQNARNQTTTLTYYADGRLQEKAAPEGTSTYTYNANKQLTRISSPGSVSRTYGYDPKGRMNSITETLPGSSAFFTTFTYDDKGRLSTTTHPSGITETNNYNGNGYLASVSAGGATRWTTTGMNARGQVTAGRYGSNLNATFSYNGYGYPTSTVTGTLQSYQYDFNAVTGNLNWRKNVIQANIQENFEYDGLDRLDRVYRGSITLLNMEYLTNKGGITTKSDVGNFSYDKPEIPYAVSDFEQTGTWDALEHQDVDYTSFESILAISEGTKSASFIYNSDNERARMEVLDNDIPVLIRWYVGGQYIKETTGGVTKEYTFIGGDAYSAPVVAVTQGGSTVYYNLLRDYLGSITHVVDASNNSLVAEYSYDAWGRMRDPATWQTYDPGSEPDLFIAGRGFTGHEHLKWFSLINMNGRMYDPLTGQFLSPDNYVQAPDFSQNFNRYSYCLNNPLIYTDPSGEKLKWWQWGVLDILTGGFITATVPAMVSTEVAATFTTLTSLNPINALFGNQSNATDIWVGLFQTDPNLSTEDRILQFASRFTWEGIQTDLGYNYSQIRNLFGGVDNVDYYGGATLVNRNDNSGKWWGLTLGPYINSKNMEADPYTDAGFRHEYGHVLQSSLVGPLYLTHVGLPSLIGSVLDEIGWSDHDREWYETQANRISEKYFRNHDPGALIALPWNDNDYPRNYNPNWYWIFAPPSIPWWLSY